MRKFKEVLRLSQQSELSQRAIARAVRVGLGTVNDYLQQARAQELSWAAAGDLDERALEQRLGVSPSGGEAAAGPGERAQALDLAAMHVELKRKGMTRRLLWQEYREAHPEGLSYSQFCDRYRRWRLKLKRSMRQVHSAGEKLFVDYAGPTVAVLDPQGGAPRQAHVFVAVLGASNYTYAEATWTETLPEWIGAHVRAMSFFGGVPALVVPDNPRVGVSRACRYDPDLNPSYAQWASHYATAVLPARPRKPRDKAKVEAGVLLVERWILARLRHHRFFSLAELNAAIAELLTELNRRPFQKLPGSRLSQFEALDKPALKPLPARPYEYTEIKRVRVHVDYHIEFERHYYSVPHRFVGQQLEAHVSAAQVRVLHRDTVVAAHLRSRRQGGFTTDPDHMPESHREHKRWTPERLIGWGGTIGPAVQAFTEHLLAHRDHPEQGYRACLGLLSLSRRYPNERLDAACARALTLPGARLKSVKNILRQGLDRLEPDTVDNPDTLPVHDNVRGASYYH